MEHQSAGSSRLSVYVFTVAVLLLLLPFAAVPPANALSEYPEDTLASPGSRTMRVGWPGLVDDLQTLNPLLAVRDAEVFVTKVTYSTLVTRDVSSDFVGDLATKCEVLPDLMTWHIQIVETANFYDKNVPGEQMPLTTADVMFTYWLIQNNSDINQPYAFPELPSAGGSLIESMWANGDFEMWIKLRVPYAPFLSALSVIPILPKYIWETKNWDWPNFDVTYPPCVGSGPWYYGLDGTPDGYTVVMYENPEWFAAEEYGWQLHVDTLVLRSESEDSNLMNYLSLGSDVMTRITPAQYIGGGLGGTKWQSSQGFVFEFNMNQLTEENRDLYDIPGATSYNNQLLLDPVVKLALQMSVDKDEFVTDVLYGLGKPADSLIPEVSPWRYDYGGGDLGAPPGEEEIPFDPFAARMMLYDNGWRYRLTGTEILPEDPDYYTYYPLSRSEVTDTLHFRYITPNTQSYFAAGAQLIRQDAASTGISLVLSVEPPMVMDSAWRTADYDTWLWHWEFLPTSEPSVDVMHHLTTDAIGVWSDVYWSNASYDALYNNSIVEVDPGVRKLILDEMQRMAYLHSGCWPVAWMDSLYAAQSVSPDFWQNFGNWTESYPLVIDSGYPWLFTQVYPLDNPAPQIVNWIECYEGLTTIPIPFDATVVDEGPPSALEYMWNFGDGTKSPWMSSASIEHLYSEDGYYDVWLIVKEMDTLDGFISSEKATVCITGTNTVPHELAFTYEPSDPDNGTLIHFNGTAVDDDPLTYSWDFGDGSTAQGQNVTHQFIVGSQTYTVTMYVDDGHVSHPGGVRPVSTTRLVTVTENTAPTIVAQDEPFVLKNVPFLFRVYAYDPDVRDTLRFTWDWGDLSDPSVTTTDTAWHTYSRGVYTLTVWCDDLTGLDGHNQSDTAIISVSLTPNYAPVIQAFYVSNEMPVVEETVTFYGTVTDRDNDLCTYTWDFGDTNTDVSVQTEVNSTLSIEHTYMSEGVFFADLTVTDGFFTVEVLELVPIYVLPPTNVPPEVDPLPEVHAEKGIPQEFTATASDVDGDPLTYTWDFHDGTPLQVGNPVMHTYDVVSGEFGMLYTVYVDDGLGGTHNVSVNGIAFVVLPMVTLELVVGWNLVTVPLMDHGYTAASMGLVYGEIMVSWDPATQTYDKTFYPQYPFTDFSLEPMTGYWISSTRDRTVELTGEIPTSPVERTLTVPDGGGWALVGIPSMDGGLMASDLVAMYSGAVSMVCSYNELTHAYKTYYPIYPFTDFALTVGEGLWVYCGASGVLTYEP